MIRYSLRCATGHGFEAWFSSARGFDDQQAAGEVLCAVCGDPRVDKAPMAPAVRTKGAGRTPGTAPAPAKTPASVPTAPPGADALAALRARLEREADYVGSGFAAEARAIEAGEAPSRPIWGEARTDEVRALTRDGIEVTPLPFVRPPRH